MGTADAHESHEHEATGQPMGVEVQAAACGVDEPARMPLLPVRQSEWTRLWQASFLDAARDTQTAAAQVSATYQRLAAIAGLPTTVALTAAERSAAEALAPVLLDSIATTWAFTTGIDANHIMRELRIAAALVHEHRSVASQVREPWSAQVTAACREALALLREREALRAGLPEPWSAAVVETMERGVRCLRHIVEQEPRLTVQYDATRLNASALESGWQRAEQSFWPLAALRKRRIRKALAAAVTGGGEPDPVADLPILGDLEQTRAEIAAMDLRALPREVWSGLDTRIDVAETALRLQPALEAVRRGSREIAEDLDLVASGLCGPDLKQTLESMRRLVAIDAELDRFEWLSGETDGLWASTSTAIDALADAVDFCDELRAGDVSGGHDAVARGDCGDSLRTQLELLRQRDWMAKRISEFGHLGAITDGLWRGLDTDVREVRRAVNFGEVLERALAVLASTPGDVANARSGVGRICRWREERGVVLEAGSAFLAACSDLAAALDKMTQSGRFSSEDKARFENMAPRELHAACEAMIAAVEKWDFAPPESVTP